MRAVLLLALVVGCTDEATSIHLDVQMPDPSALDGLAIVVDNQRTLAPVAGDLTVLVPDDWAGAAVRIEVQGLRSDALVSIGATELVPVRGDDVYATIQLVDVNCPTVCTPGDMRCDGDAVATCVMAGSCPVWAQPAACPSTAPFCSNGTCAVTCSDECTSGATSCDGTGAVRSCANVDGDSCLDWTTTACAADEQCNSGTCEGPMCPATCAVGSEATSGLGPIATDGNYIYWLERAGVMRRNETSGVTEVLVAATLTVPKAIAVDAQHVYWLDNDEIRRAPKTGGAHESVYVGNTDLASFTIDSTHVFWTEYDNRKIQRRTKTLGAVTKVLDTDLLPLRLAIDGADLYFNDYDGASGGQLLKMKKDGSTTPVPLVTERVYSFAIDATHVYFMGAGVGRIGKSGGSVTTIATDADGSHVAIDSTHVAWMDGSALQMRAKSGGPTEAIGTGENQSTVALGPTHAAWASTGGTDLQLAPRCACEP